MEIDMNLEYNYIYKYQGKMIYIFLILKKVFLNSIDN